jgi:uncharacterized membrane protein
LGVKELREAVESCFVQAAVYLNGDKVLVSVLWGSSVLMIMRWVVVVVVVGGAEIGSNG